MRGGKQAGSGAPHRFQCGAAGDFAGHLCLTRRTAEDFASRRDAPHALSGREDVCFPIDHISIAVDFVKRNHRDEVALECSLECQWHSPNGLDPACGITGHRLDNRRFPRVAARTRLVTNVGLSLAQPLVAQNAHLNLNGLGADIERYVPEMYGSNTGSDLHSGLGTDRFVALWRIGVPDVQRVIDGVPRIPSDGFDRAPIVNSVPSADGTPLPVEVELPTLPAVRIDRVIGVAKAYVTRVGEGPFPSEIEGPMAIIILGGLLTSTLLNLLVLPTLALRFGKFEKTADASA